MDGSRKAAAHRDRIHSRITALRAACDSLLADAPAFVWEVGCGNGHFLAAYAAAHPDSLCVGIDRNPDRVGRAARKGERAGLENLHFLTADSADFLAALPERAVLSAIYLLFPDPWPKRRHRANRVLEPGFLSEAARRAGRGARLYFRTDDEPYFAEALGTVSRHPDWRPVVDSPWPFEAPTLFQLRAERFLSLTAERR